MSRIAEIPPENQIYVDESGINTAIQRDYGRVLRGVRVEDAKPGWAYQRLNVIGAYWGTGNGVSVRRLAVLPSRNDSKQ